MDFALLRHRMVERQLRARGITDKRLLAVMEQAPRHLFVPAGQRARAYEDEPLPIGLGQTISQPFMVAKMTELLCLTGDETVLEVGTGSGYQAAVLGRLAARVWTIERHPRLAGEAERVLTALGMENVRVLVGDGTLGLPEEAPFDAIIVTAAAPTVPESLKEQLAVAGVMVIPIAATRGGQELVKIEQIPAAEGPAATPGAAGGSRTMSARVAQEPAATHGPAVTSGQVGAPACHFRETVVLGCIFVPLIGKEGYPG